MLPMRFEISMGVRKKDAALRAELNSALTAQREAIEELLRAYHLPSG
jgi:hypothetical protein